MNGWLRHKETNFLSLLMLLQLMLVRHPVCTAWLLSGTRIIINYYLSSTCIVTSLCDEAALLLSLWNLLKSLILKQCTKRNKFMSCGSPVLTQRLSLGERKKILKKRNFCQGKSKNIRLQTQPDASGCTVTEMRQISNFMGKKFID